MEGVKGSPGAASSEGVLANFFNSLLNKKTGIAPPAGATPGRGSTSGVRSDAAAELDRMNRSRKVLSNDQDTSNS